MLRMSKDNALVAHLKKIRKLVKPENCARTSEQATKAVTIKWAKWRAERGLSVPAK